MRITVSCGVGYGEGGLGGHFAEIVERYRHTKILLRYYCPRPRPGDDGIGIPIRSRFAPIVCRYSPARFDRGLCQFVDSDWFDRAVAWRIREAADAHVGFSGQVLRTFGRTRELGAHRLELVSPTAHLDAVWRQHEAATAAYPYERHWLHRSLLIKGLREYDLADHIHVGSEYARQSFVAAGVPLEKIEVSRLRAAPRFRRRAARRPSDGVFRIVYTGGLTVTKGVPLLLEAFTRANLGRAALTLVGQTGSRGMRRYLETRLTADPRVRVRPGDPLPHLEEADIYVHPSYQDGFGYAVAEALAVGLGVVVTEDTGAKELVRPGVDGWVVPTGNVDALVAALEEARRRPLPDAGGSGTSA
jgi:glycosyltransferase involved in cell wall biosynthesis